MLKIELPLVGDVYVFAVILVAPLVAAGMLAAGYSRSGGWLLLFSMTGSLLFGGYKHYVEVSNDHVLQTPDTTWGMVFRATAAGLIFTELVVAMLAGWVVRRSGQQLPPR